MKGPLIGTALVAFILIVTIVVVNLTDYPGRVVSHLTQAECQQLGGEWKPPSHSIFPGRCASRCFLEDARLE